MKKLILFFAVFNGALFAAFPPSEEIQFRFVPSFTGGTLFSLARGENGKVRCAAYRLPAAGGPEIRSKSRPVLLSEADVSADDFQALVGQIEGQVLRTEAETADQVGVDGAIWSFRRKTGGRVIELNFWSPEIRKGSAAYALGMRFAKVVHLEGILPDESSDPHGDIPKVVPALEFKKPNPERASAP